MGYQSYKRVKTIKYEVLIYESTIPIYSLPGTVTFVLWPPQIKMDIQEPIEESQWDDAGINQAIYTDRVHTGIVKGVLIPPFKLVGPVPETAYSVNQWGASVSIKLSWSDTSSKITTVALPFQKTAYYGQAMYRWRRMFNDQNP